MFEVGQSVDEPPTLPITWKDQVTTDLHAVVSRIPHVGHAKGTYREALRRPSAYLYFRPDLLGTDERARCFDRAESCTGAPVRGGFQLSRAAGQVRVTGTPTSEIYSGHRLVREDGVVFMTDTLSNGNGWPFSIDENGEAWIDVEALTEDERAETEPGVLLAFADLQPPGVDQVATVGERGIKRYLNGPIVARAGYARTGSGWWVRVNGESAFGDGRQASKPCARADIDAPYMLEFRWSTSLPGPVSKITLDFAKQVTTGALAVGCRVRQQERKGPSPIYADSLEQLVLAVHWSPVLAHAVWWSLLGIELKSDAWTVAVDHACHLGRPWSEAMAKLSQRDDSDAIIRALRWMYENKGTR